MEDAPQPKEPLTPEVAQRILTTGSHWYTCDCDGCWACVGHIPGCTCDVDWDALTEQRLGQ